MESQSKGERETMADVTYTVSAGTAEYMQHALRKDINRIKYALEHGHYASTEQERTLQGNLDMARAALAEVQAQEEAALHAGKFMQGEPSEMHATTCSERDEAAVLKDAERAGRETQARVAAAVTDFATENGLTLAPEVQSAVDAAKRAAGTE
jgi:hypothetical protein